MRFRLILLITIISLSQPSRALAKTVLITGGNRGIGLGLVKHYLRDDNTVIATTRNLKNSNELKQLNNDKLITIKVDLLDDDKAIEQIQQVVKNMPIDLLIHNAGFFPYKANRGPAFDSKEWLDALQVYTIMPVKISIALLNNLKQSQTPVIVAISTRRASFHRNSKDSYIGRYGYRSTKAAMNSAMQALSQDLKNESIPVVILHPGRVATDMTKYDGISSQESAALISRIISNTTMKNSGQFIDATDGKVIEW